MFEEFLLRVIPPMVTVALLFGFKELSGDAWQPYPPESSTGVPSVDVAIGDPVIVSRDHGNGPWNDWGTGPDQYDQWLQTQ